MTTFGWQDALAAALAACALAWLVRRRLRRKASVGCENCPAARGRAAAGTDFVPLGDLGGIGAHLRR